MSRQRNRIPFFPHHEVDLFYPGGFTFRDEANALVALALSDGPLRAENTTTESGCKTPSIPLTEDQMRAVIVHAARNLEDLLQLRFYGTQENYYTALLEHGVSACKGWHRTRAEDQALFKRLKKHPS